jgi:hypothetical protein
MERELLQLLNSFDNTENFDTFVKKLEPYKRQELITFLLEILKTQPKDEKFVAYLQSYLFEDSKEYSEALLSFIEQPEYYDKFLDTIRSSAISDKKSSLLLVKRLLSKGRYPGLVSGLLLAWIMEEDTNAQSFFLKCFRSIKKFEGLCAIRALDLILSHKNWFNDITKMIALAKKIPFKFFELNPDSCFIILQQGYDLDPKSFEPILIKKIEEMGFVGANAYANAIQFGKTFSVSALEKTIIILESNAPFSYTTERAIVKLYQQQPDFVIEVFRNRIKNIQGLYILSDLFLREIVKLDNQHLIKMIESEIILGNPKIIEIGEDLLRKCFFTSKECIFWCENNYEDPRKQELIIRVLKEILSSGLTVRDNSSNEDAIKLTRKIANCHNIDFEKLTKHISNDKKGGSQSYQETIKALSILEKIQEVMETPVLDIEQLKRNLKYIPNIVRVLDEEWFLSEAQSTDPHFLIRFFSVEPPIGEELTDDQKYWEDVFTLLNKAKIPIPKKKLQDHENALNILTECEIFAKICPYFKIFREPHIKQLGNSRLEARIEWKGESALIEIRTVHSSREMNLSGGGGITIIGPRLKGIIFEKFEKQLKEGQFDLKEPVILILFFITPLEYRFAENSIYGQLSFSTARIEGTNKIVEEGVRRENNGFFVLKGSEIISSIAKCQKIPWNFESPFQGKLLRPNRPPQNKISQEFWVRLRDALFTSNVDCDVTTLQQVRGIGGKTACLLYNNGIEDIVALVLINPNDFLIPGISTKRLSLWQKEARRIINARTTKSIRFLKNLNEETFDILFKEEIFLIEDLLKRKTPPKGISSKRWKRLHDDAKHILRI